MPALRVFLFLLLAQFCCQVVKSEDQKAAALQQHDCAVTKSGGRADQSQQNTYDHQQQHQPTTAYVNVNPKGSQQQVAVESGESCNEAKKLTDYITLRRRKLKSNVLLINTIDGMFHAIEIFCNMDAKHLWSRSIDSDMVEHNLNSLMKSGPELLQNGNRILIPSLNGEFYMLQNGKLSKIDLKHDNILSSLGISGAKTVNLFGIDLFTGDQIYKCSAGECQHTSENHRTPRSTLILTQNQFQFRYIESSNGHSHINMKVSDFSVEVKSNMNGNKLNQLSNSSTPFNNIRLQLTGGNVLIVDNEGFITFQAQLNAPIVDAWLVSNDALHKIPMFSSPTNPSIDKNLASRSNFVYIGKYKNQLFIKNSNSNVLDDQKAIVFNADYHRSFFDFLNDTIQAADGVQESLQSDGVYIGYSGSDSKEILHSQLQHEHPLTIKSHEKVTLSKFYKEIIFICIVTSVLFHLSICRFSRQKSKKTMPDSPDLNIAKLQSPLINGEDSFEENQKSPIRRESSSSPVAEELVPETFKSRFFDDFEFICLIGRGSFGVVYSCKQYIDLKEYAIKQINLPDRKIDRERLYREVHALAHLDHPNILRYYQSWIEEPSKGWYRKKAKDVFLDTKTNAINMDDFESLLNPSVRLMGEFNEQECMLTFKDQTNAGDMVVENITPKSSVFPMLFIQNELCRCSLHDWLNYGTVPPKNRGNDPLGSRKNLDRYRILYQLSSAIDYVHNKGLMHRDLKPANIFFNADKMLKLGDFGLVCFHSGSKSTLSAEVKNHLTDDIINSASDVGTYLYMAPEVLEGKSYSQKIDIYSMALIFYETLSLFNTYSEKLISLRELRNRAKFNPKFVEEFKSATKLIKFMLIKNPKKRYSHSKVLSEIKELYDLEMKNDD